MTNETRTSDSEVLDIRKVPVSELQTRDGREVLGVFDNTAESESSMWRCLVVMKLEDGGLDSVTMSTAGRVWSDKETAFDIIRKMNIPTPYELQVLKDARDKEYLENQKQRVVDCFTKHGYQSSGTLSKDVAEAFQAAGYKVTPEIIRASFLDRLFLGGHEPYIFYIIHNPTK